MIKTANLGKEIAIKVVNKIGVLADMSGLLANSKVNIEAVAGYAVGNEAKIMLVTDDNPHAIDILKKSGYNSIQEDEVVIVELDNKVGALKNITAKLAAQSLDIKQVYGTVSSIGSPAKIILSTSDNTKALTALKK